MTKAARKKYFAKLAAAYQVDPAHVAALAATLGPREDLDALPLAVAELAALIRIPEVTE
jgi:hypothetical protein